MTISLLSCVVFALAFVVGGVLGVLYGRLRSRRSAELDLRAREKDIADLHVQLASERTRSSMLEEYATQMEEQVRGDNNVLRALGPIQQSLQTMDNLVRHVEKQQAAQRAQLNEQFASATRIQEQLAKETSSLRGALTGHSSRGMWGEMKLQRIVEVAGMTKHVDFDTQVSTVSGSRPDMVIHLPGNCHIAVDSKVPLSALLALQDLSNTDSNVTYLRSQTDEPREIRSQRQALLKQHTQDMKGHIRELGRRNYPSMFPGSPQFTLMFLPSESLLSLALEEDSTLLEYAYSYGVALVSPTSLLAILRSFTSVWSTASATEDAKKVVELGKTLVSRLESFMKHMETLGKSLSSGVNSYNKALGSLETRVFATARNLSSLECSLETPAPIEASLRIVNTPQQDETP